MHLAKTAQYWIDQLDLTPHPEGGWYKETFRSDVQYDGRSVATGIYFLLTAENVSNFHRIDAEEMWHFYAGDPLTVHIIDGSGDYATMSIGPDIDGGQQFQAVVPANVWFGSSVDKPEGYALVGCTVSPGFEFDSFELAGRAAMLGEFPQHEVVIKQLTKSDSEE